MGGADPLSAAVVVVKVELADIVQQPAQKGHVGGAAVELVLLAEHPGRQRHFNTVFQQAALVVMVVVMTRFAAIEGGNKGFIKQQPLDKLTNPATGQASIKLP